MKNVVQAIATLAVVFLGAPVAFADMVLVKDNHVYQVPGVPSILNQKIASFQSQLYFVLDEKDGYFSFSGDKLVQLPAAKAFKTPVKPTIPELEGCARYPIEWVPKAKIIADLKDKKTKGKLYIGLSSDAKVSKLPSDFNESLAKLVTVEWKSDPPLKAKDIEQYTTKSVSSGKSLLAFTLFDDGLNQSIFVAEKAEKSPWKKVFLFTITDHCP